MPYGSGSFSLLHDFAADKAAGPPTSRILASRMMEQLEDIADGLTTALSDNEAQQADIDNLLDGNLFYAGTLTENGNANTLVATINGVGAIIGTGFQFTAKVTNANTGAMTINVNSQGVKAIKRMDGAAMEPGDLAAGSHADFIYDGTNWLIRTRRASELEEYLQSKLYVVSPSYYGVVGDGTTDDAAAIQAMIDAVANSSAAGAVLIDFGSKSYAITVPILVKSRISVRGGRFKAIAGTWNDSAKGALYVSNGVSITFYDVEVDGNSLARNGFLNASTGGVKFINCKATHCTEAQFLASAACQIAHCHAQQWTTSDTPSWYTPASRTADGFSVKGADVKLVNCVGSYSRYPLYMSSAAHHIQVSSCHFFNGAGAFGPITDPTNVYIDGAYKVIISDLYWDNGIIQYVRPASQNFELVINGAVQLYDTGSTTLNKWVVLHTTVASSELGDLFLSDIVTGGTIPFFDLTVAGAGSWARLPDDIETIQSPINIKDGTHYFASSDNNALVAAYHSSHADRSLARFKSISTTAANGAEFGADGDSAIVRTNGTTRAVFDSTGGYVGATATLANEILTRDKGFYVLGNRGTDLTALTGSTAETKLYSVQIPANSLGSHGCVRVRGEWSCTSNANTKTMRANLGTADDVAGSATLASHQETTNSNNVFEFVIRNNGATNAQRAGGGGNSGGIGGTTTGRGTSVFDTTAAIYLLVTGQLANAGDTMTLHGVTVEALYDGNTT